MLTNNTNTYNGPFRRNSITTHIPSNSQQIVPIGCGGYNDNNNGCTRMVSSAEQLHNTHNVCMGGILHSNVHIMCLSDEW